MIIDVEKCEDCNNCFLACKDEHVGNDWKGYSLSQPLHGHRWMNIMRKERGQCPMIDVAYLPIPCMHCDRAPCIEAAKGGAAYKREDGIVIIDPEKARGQQAILQACPYNAIWWNEEKNVPQKCTFCAHLLDNGWKEPRCVQACPTGALKVLKVDETATNHVTETEGLDILKPELNTQPRVHYKNLFRYTKCFVAGSVALEKNGLTECAEGAKVLLIKDKNMIDEAVTDNYGDFKLDRLDEESGIYELEIQYEDYERKRLEVELKLSVSLGTIFL